MNKLLKDILSHSIKSLIRFVSIFFIIFAISFFTVFLFHFSPILKIGFGDFGFKDVIKLLVFPSLCVGIYNSLILSYFTYGIIFINFQKKFRIVYYFIPIALSVVVVFPVHFFLNPDAEKISFTNIDDARVYFNEKSFFDYSDSIPEKIDKKTFEKELIDKIDSQAEKKSFSDKYIFNMKDDCYRLRKNLSEDKRNSILRELYKINYIRPKRFFLSKVNKDSADNVILIKGDFVSSYKKVNISFIKDKIYIEIPSSNERYEFDKLQLNDYDIYKFPFLKTLFKSLGNVPYKFFIYKNSLYSVLLIAAIAFLILNFSTIIIIADYKFLSALFKGTFLLTFYFSFPILFDLYRRSYNLFLPSVLFNYNELFFILAIFILGLIVGGLRILFFKTNVWERN